jgi:DnaJ-class molecular chaperone
MESPADNYWPEPCGACRGKGKLELNFERLPNGVREFALRYQMEPECPVCKGKAFALMLQPAQKCRYCGGAGRLGHCRCFYCLGAGWMFALKERDRYRERR